MCYKLRSNFTTTSLVITFSTANFYLKISLLILYMSTGKIEKEERIWTRRIGGGNSAVISIPKYIMDMIGCQKRDYLVIKYNVHKKDGKIIGGDNYFVVDNDL